MKIVFDNTWKPFHPLKTNTQFERAPFLVELISKEYLEKIGTVITKSEIKARLPFQKLTRSIVFDLFWWSRRRKWSSQWCENVYKRSTVHAALDYSVEGKKGITRNEWPMVHN